MKPTDPPPTDDFERHLARVPQRPAPPRWRAEILTAAQASAVAPVAQRSPKPATPVPTSLSGQVLAWLGGLSPAWRTLAAAWIVCLTVNHFAGTALSKSETGQWANRANGRLTSEQIAAARAQRREILQLAGLTDPEPAEPPPARPPRPRSSLPVPACG